MSQASLHVTERRPLGGPAAWRGDVMADNPVWQHTLTAAEIDEIDRALAAVTARGLSWRQVTKDAFPLPNFAGTLAEVARLLEDGPGLMRLRGLPIERYDEAGQRAIFFGLGSHLGTPVTQTSRGELMAAITDEGEARDQRGRVATKDGSFLSSRGRVQSTGQLRFHTDRVDVVALLCINQAASGGLSKVASAVAIHDAMLTRRPDLLELLFQDYYRSRFGEEDRENRDWYALPIFALEGPHFTTHYSRTYIEAAQFNPELPKMSEAEWQAIDLMAELAEELCLTMTLEPGDMQFLNNHVLFHARTAYEDEPEAAWPRLLYRLWLSMPNSRPLPKGHAVLFGDVRPGALRGGIRPSAG